MKTTTWQWIEMLTLRKCNSATFVKCILYQLPLSFAIFTACFVGWFAFAPLRFPNDLIQILSIIYLCTKTIFILETYMLQSKIDIIKASCAYRTFDDMKNYSISLEYLTILSKYYEIKVSV